MLCTQCALPSSGSLFLHLPTGICNVRIKVGWHRRKGEFTVHAMEVTWNIVRQQRSAEYKRHDHRDEHTVLFKAFFSIWIETMRKWNRLNKRKKIADGNGTPQNAMRRLAFAVVRRRVWAPLPRPQPEPIVIRSHMWRNCLFRLKMEGVFRWRENERENSAARVWAQNSAFE